MVSAKNVAGQHRKPLFHGNYLMSLYSDRLAKLAKILEDDEAQFFLEWIVEGLEDVGFEHNEMCAITRLHSHSADCDCGRDELQEKVMKVLRGV